MPVLPALRGLSMYCLFCCCTANMRARSLYIGGGHHRPAATHPSPLCPPPPGLDELSARTITACGHHYCSTCIREVLAHGSRTCPICRMGEPLGQGPGGWGGGGTREQRARPLALRRGAAEREIGVVAAPPWAQWSNLGTMHGNTLSPVGGAAERCSDASGTMLPCPPLVPARSPDRGGPV